MEKKKQKMDTNEITVDDLKTKSWEEISKYFNELEKWDYVTALRAIDSEVKALKKMFTAFIRGRSYGLNIYSFVSYIKNEDINKILFDLCLDTLLAKRNNCWFHWYNHTYGALDVLYNKSNRELKILVDHLMHLLFLLHTLPKPVGMKYDEILDEASKYVDEKDLVNTVKKIKEYVEKLF